MTLRGSVSLSVPVFKASALPRGGFLLQSTAAFDPDTFTFRILYVS